MLGFIADRLRRFVLHLRLLPAALALVWRAAPLWSCLWAALLLLQGLLPLVTVYLSRSLVDGLVAAARAGGAWQAARGPLLAAGLIAAAALLAELLRAAGGWVRTQATELVQDHISDLVHRKSAEVDLAFYDSADFFDRLHRARAEAGYRPVALLESLGGGLQNAVTLAAMLVVLTSFGWWVPAALAGGTAPALFVVLRHAVRQHQLRVRTTADERRTWYYDWLLTARESAAEVRLFGLGGHFRAVYQEIRTRLRGENGRLARGNALAQLGAGVLGLGITGGCLAWMLLRSLRGAATLGELALFYQAFQQGLRIAQALLDNVGQTYYNSLFLGNLL